MRVETSIPFALMSTFSALARVETSIPRGLQGQSVDAAAASAMAEALCRPGDHPISPWAQPIVSKRLVVPLRAAANRT